MLLVANMLNDSVNTQAVYLLSAIYFSDYGRPRIFCESRSLNSWTKRGSALRPAPNFLGEE